MAEIPNPTERLDPEGKAFLDELIEKRGTVDGLYRTMLLNPDLSKQVAGFGYYLRYESKSLSDRHRELVILRVAGLTRTPYEWIKHVPPATEAGISATTIEELREGEMPSDIPEADVLVLEAADLALAHISLPAALQAKLIGEIGEAGAIEVVILAGFYAAIAGFLTAFDVPLPEGAVEPF